MVMRTLATARLLWGPAGAVPVDALVNLVAPGADTVLAIERLCEEGIAERHGDAVRLTERAACDLLRRRAAPAVVSNAA